MKNFKSWLNLDEDLREKMQAAAKVVMQKVFKVKKGERILIVTNPFCDTAQISMALYDAAKEEGAEPSMIFQEEKTLLDYADESVIAAIKTDPEIFLSVSNNKLGKDKKGMMSPYLTESNVSYDHIFDFNLSGRKNMRAAWTPGITLDMFARTVCIDYDLLKKRCSSMVDFLKGASTIRVTAPGGTDITISVKGRKAFADDGDFSVPGNGGNIPAGEVFISPAVGSSEGIIVFDGSMTLKESDILIENPIAVTLERGYITKIEGKKEATLLENVITEAEKQSLRMEEEGLLSKGLGAEYKKNARHIGELGIGLNPSAKITGNMLEDEKAFRTCHFAIGSNYDNDANTLIHLDGVVKNPTITVRFEDGREAVIEEKGELKLF